MARGSKNYRGILFKEGILVLLITAGVYGVVSGKGLLNRWRAGANYVTASVSPGYIQLTKSGNRYIGSLSDSGLPGNQITVTQDTGYFVHLSGGSAANGPVQVAQKLSNGTYTAWGYFSTGTGTQVTAVNGTFAVDFSQWPPVAPGRYEAKFRVSSNDSDAQSVVVNVIPADMTQYFPFQPGNYYVMTDPNNIYWARFDVEENTTLSTNWNNQNVSINTNPLRVTMSYNNPWVDMSNAVPEDFTWWLSAGFDPIGGRNSKWALMSSFYKRPGRAVIRKDRIWNAVFFPRNIDSWPGYFSASQTQDLREVLDTHPMYTLAICPYTLACAQSNYNGGAIIPTNVSDNYAEVGGGGWKTAYRVIYINTPGYSGPAIRIRYWEYVGTNAMSSTNVNNDDWYFAKGLGLVRINSQTIKGTLCSLNAVCANTAVTMDNPVGQGVSLVLSSAGIFNNGDTVSAAVSNGGAYTAYLSMTGGSAYTLRVLKQDGSPYSGFLEVTGNNGATRSVFKGINSLPVEVVNGYVNIPTSVAQKGHTYTVRVRPYIFTERTYVNGSELAGVNRLGWSNTFSVAVQ